jgi:ethanolaminephosphotransferase
MGEPPHFSFVFNFSPSLSQCVVEPPAWLFYYHAVALFAYQTLDAIDGKQARRTGTSSPLGELFDHGCDAISTVTISLTTCGVMQIGASWFSFVLIVVSCFAFFMAATEQFHTGWLILGYINVTEAQLLVMGIYAAAGYFGHGFWSQAIPMPEVVQSWTAVVGFEKESPLWFPILAFVVFSALATAAGNFYKIFTRPSVAGADAVQKLLGIFPFAAHVALATLWARDSPKDVLHTTPVLFLLPVGMICALQVGQLVVSRVCMQRATIGQPLLLWTIAGYTNTHFDFLDETTFLWCFVAGSILGYAHFATVVIQDFCKHLGIQVLTIEPKV